MQEFARKKVEEDNLQYVVSINYAFPLFLGRHNFEFSRTTHGGMGKIIFSWFCKQMH